MQNFKNYIWNCFVGKKISPSQMSGNFKIICELEPSHYHFIMWKTYSSFKILEYRNSIMFFKWIGDLVHCVETITQGPIQEFLTGGSQPNVNKINMYKIIMRAIVGLHFLTKNVNCNKKIYQKLGAWHPRPPSVRHEEGPCHPTLSTNIKPVIAC